MTPKTDHPTPSENKSISISGDVRDSNIIIGDNNTVNQTIIQKIFNIFKGDAESLEQRNRRILLGHVENFWIKGVLEKSLHGAALLELGIKEDPEAVKTYPWAIKKEETNETLPAGTSMLEIFDSIGMGRSLLILGAPGSGKTTMLLELARQLIERARQDVTEPIPIVFNLASWKENLTLADWLAQELNIIYMIPKKLAFTWLEENRTLLLLDGLDEVKRENRDKCVNAINQFRKENGLTSMSVCSRIQDYSELKMQVSFEGAIRIQPLTTNQVNEYFTHFGEGLAGAKQVLEKDAALQQLAETPLILSIMALAYRNKPVEELTNEKTFSIEARRKHLFNTYTQEMFKRRALAKNNFYTTKQIQKWLSWLANKTIQSNNALFIIENMQPTWLSNNSQWGYRLFVEISFITIFGILGKAIELLTRFTIGQTLGLFIGVIIGLIFGFRKINMVDSLGWNRTGARKGLIGSLLIILLINGLFWQTFAEIGWSMWVLINGYCLFPLLIPIGLLFMGLIAQPISETSYPGQRIFLSIKSLIVAFLSFWLIYALTAGILGGLIVGVLAIVAPNDGLKEASNGLTLIYTFGLLTGMVYGLLIAPFFALVGSAKLGGMALIQHYSLRFIIALNNLLPWRLVPFLDHCVDLIFLRRVGGGYIFIHRLLMEHFAEMYEESA